MSRLLGELVAGKRALEGFSVTYDDLHPLHGGLTLTLHGSGKVEQEARREEVGSPGFVSREQVLELIALLRTHEAWVQRVPEREPGADESRSRLMLRVGSIQTAIWEWFNDLSKNQRMVLIRDLMKQVAWTSLPK